MRSADHRIAILALIGALGFAPLRAQVPRAECGRAAPDSVCGQLVALDVPYRDFAGVDRVGRVVCNRLVERDLRGLFDTLLRSGYRFASVRPISEFGFSDSLSMLADNTSSYNWRKVKGVDRLSPHALGFAIDLAPLRNPFEHRKGSRPAGAVHDPRVPGTLTDTSLAVRFLRARGWWWGGRWASGCDWQHFELTPARARLNDVRPSSMHAKGAR